ncbi:MAG: site-2 protease family protein [Oscillospiraceae bacterium]|nr:site-2 protease family protein [Oscillospiraceae bacterium]
MTIILTIIKTVLILGALIFIHELGHFIVAKLGGVQVNEFALGMGPRIIKFEKNHTIYSLRIFPIGGFVAMEGEDGEKEGDDNPRAFCRRPKWIRALILFAGAAMNVILGFAITVALVCSSELLGTTTIAKFYDDAVSSQQLMVNDEIIKINGTRTKIDDDILFALSMDDDGVVDFTVRRNGEIIDLKNVAFTMRDGDNGSKSMYLDFQVYGVEKTFFGVIKQSFYQTIAIVRTVWMSLMGLLGGKYSITDLSGPVGVGAAVQQASSFGWSSLFYLISFITINLGVFNLLPFPALDGGRLLFLLIEAIRGKPLNQKWEGIINFAGLAILMIFMLVVTCSDVLKLF